MDAVSYSLAAKQAKRIDNLFYVGETEPTKIVIGQEWYVPSTGKTYKRVTDGTTEVWLDISATGSGLVNHSEEFVVGTASGNYTGVSTTVFPTIGSFNSSFANVYMNGSKLSSSDYTTDGTSITLNTAATNGDVIAIETYNTFSIGDAYTKGEIDAGYATKTLSTTADLDVLNKVKNVDGALSGLDADLLRGLPADFTASKVTNGYQKLPSGSIIQWGMMLAADDNDDVSFPITFPNAVFSFVATAKSSSHSYPVQVKDLTTSYFNIDSQVGGNPKKDTYWLAIGY